jgi:hemolysin activation/secretion protein
VKLTDIERRVLLASDVPGLSLRSTLTPGLDTGAAKLVLEGTDKLVSGSVGVDNNLPRSLAGWEYSSGLQLNSVFGQGEQIYLSATAGYNLGDWFDGRTPIQIFGGGFVLPIGIDGFTINPEYTNAETRPEGPSTIPPTTGYFQRADLRASYPVIRTRNETLTVSSTLEWDQEYLVARGFGVDLYDDNYFVERLKAESLTSFPGGSGVQASGVLSQGLGGRTGSGSIVPLSQAGASPEFTKFDVTVRWTEPLPQMFSLAVLGEGQTSFGKPLMISEQFALDGPDAVSGYPTGTFMVDEGALARAELGRTVNIPISGSLIAVEPYVFGAGGAGVIDQSTALQLGTLDVGSVGIGARTNFATDKVPVGAALGLELARYFSNVPSEREGWRGNLSFSIRF